MIERIQYLLARAVYGGGNLFLEACRAALFRRPKNPSAVLVFRTGSLGDSFGAIPAISALRDRFPRSRLILLTARTEDSSPGAAGILERLVDFDQIITYDVRRARSVSGLRKLAEEVKKEKVDLAVYLPHYNYSFRRIVRDLFFFRLAGCRAAAGFKWQKHVWFSSAQRKYRRFERESLRLMNLLQPLGINGPGSAWRVLSRGRQRPERGRPVIAIHPAANFPAKRWPTENFRRLIVLLRERLDPELILVGGEGSTGISLEPELSRAGRFSDLRGRTDCPGLMEALKNSDLLITSDSGPGHVAAAVGTPVVGIYSARDYPGCWYPFGNNNVILRKNPPCQVCLKITCPTMTCLESIEPMEVVEACERILAARPKAANRPLL